MLAASARTGGGVRVGDHRSQLRLVTEAESEVAAIPDAVCSLASVGQEFHALDVLTALESAPGKIADNVDLLHNILIGASQNERLLVLQGSLLGSSRQQQCRPERRSRGRHGPSIGSGERSFDQRLGRDHGALHFAALTADQNEQLCRPLVPCLVQPVGQVHSLSSCGLAAAVLSADERRLGDRVQSSGG
jgi:hypothetical protein